MPVPLPSTRATSRAHPHLCPCATNLREPARYRAGPVYEVEEIATEGWIVMPRVNKHISFQGDLYHGIFHHVYPQLPPPRGHGPQLRATLLVNYWQKQPLEPYCVPMPLQNAEDFASFPPGTTHPPQPRHGEPEAIEEVDMSNDGGNSLRRFPLPCDTGIRSDRVWLPERRPPNGSTSHVVWPEGRQTERVFSHVRASRFGGDPLPAKGEEARILRGGAAPQLGASRAYSIDDARADHTAAAIEFDEAGDAEAALASFRAAARFEPDASEAWSNLGMALLTAVGHEQGWAEAKGHFEKALALDAHNEQASAFIASGGKDEL